MGEMARWPQDRAPMAAVFALIFLPALAAIGLMIGASQGVDFGTVLALVCFIAMASGVFYGSLRLAQKWEAE